MSVSSLGDQIVELLRRNVEAHRAKWKAAGWTPTFYTAAVPITEIAAALDVKPNAINGAVGHLLRARRVKGVSVGLTPSRSEPYAIELLCEQ